jgi:hypothetical protein
MKRLEGITRPALRPQPPAFSRNDPECTALPPGAPERAAIRRSLSGRENWMSWRVLFRNRHRDIRSAEGSRQSCCRHGQNYTKVAARLHAVHFMYQWQTATWDFLSRRAGGSVARGLSSLSSLSLGGLCRVMAVHELCRHTYT